VTRGEESVRLSGRTKGWPNWTTPEAVLDVIELVGPIALDPCSNEAAHTNKRAKASWRCNGLTDSWHDQVHAGLVFVNPPYNQTKAFVAKAIEEALQGTEIILLVAARTDTKWAHSAFKSAQAVCFWEGRIRFENPPPDSEGDAPSIPSMFVYWGPRRGAFMRVFQDHGLAVDLTRPRLSFPVQVKP
jgi:phage N-6-adenine-methyltransferase